MVAGGGSTVPSHGATAQAGSQLVVTATTNEGYHFACWIYSIDYKDSGEVNSTQASIAVNGSEMYLTPVFEKET